MGGGTKAFTRNDWGTKLSQTKSLLYKIIKKKMFSSLFQEESHSIMFFYLQIPHCQQDSFTNLTPLINPSLLSYINPHIIVYK